MQAIIKQGITVLPGEETRLAQVMVKGSGLKTVTYSDIGTLESLIARVEKLEAALAELRRLPR